MRGTLIASERERAGNMPSSTSATIPPEAHPPGPHRRYSDDPNRLVHLLAKRGRPPHHLEGEAGDPSQPSGFSRGCHRHQPPAGGHEGPGKDDVGGLEKVPRPLCQRFADTSEWL